MTDLVSSSVPFNLGPHQTIGLVTVFNSNDFVNGGDYLGPVVPAPVSSRSLNQVMTPSTMTLDWTTIHETRFTTNVIYNFSITNNSPEPVVFTLDFFCGD